MTVKLIKRITQIPFLGLALTSYIEGIISKKCDGVLPGKKDVIKGFPKWLSFHFSASNLVASPQICHAGEHTFSGDFTFSLLTTCSWQIRRYEIP
jgi:hypothetical protein